MSNTAQVESQLLAVDDKFLRMHGVPAGQALDLYGRTLGASPAASPDAPRAARRPATNLPPSASSLRSVGCDSIHAMIPSEPYCLLYLNFALLPS